MKQPTIAIRVDAGQEIGLGHIKRCLVLANELRQRARVVFLCRNDEIAIELVRQAHFDFHACLATQDDLPWLRQKITELRIEKLIVDLPREVGRAYVAAIQKRGAAVCLLDNAGEGRQVADVVIFPNAHVAEHLCRSVDGQVFWGWKYLIVDNKFFAPRPESRQPLHILLSMGGSDLNDVTSKAVAALRDLPNDFRCDCVLGPGFAKTFDDIEDARFRVVRNAVSLADLMLQADLGVLLFGVTAHEAAAARLPSLILADPKDEQALLRFKRFGTCAALDNSRNITVEEIRLRTQRMIRERHYRTRLAKNCSKHAVPGGAERVAELVLHTDSRLLTSRNSPVGFVEQSREDIRDVA